MSAFVNTSELSTLAGVTQSALKKAITAILSGERATWRSAHLVVRKRFGREGRGGWVHEVSVASLPLDLQARFSELQTPVKLALKLDDAAAEVRNMRFHIIGPVLKTASRSPERTAAIKARAAEHFSINGRPFPTSVRSIERWTADYEAEGFAGLHRKKGADAGEAAVIVTRAFDAAVALDDVMKEQIAKWSNDFARSIIGQMR